MMQTTHFDVIVIGAGAVGLTFANAAAMANVRVAVIENQPSVTAELDSFDLRVSAINLASQQIWQALNVWPIIQQHYRYGIMQKMKVWDATGNGAIHFDALEIAEPVLGHIVENRVMQAALWQQATQHPNITLIHSTQPLRIQRELTQIRLLLPEHALTAQLLVGADGAHSWVRQQAGISLHQRSYHQHAIVTTVKTELPHQNTARQRFLSTGPLAFLPLSEPHYCSIVWSSDEAENQRLLQLSDTSFAQNITTAFAAELGDVEVCDKRLSFSLMMRHAKQYVTPRIALIGDAAHTIHPLAGQGVNLGILDAACLAESLQLAMQQQRDLGSLLTLRHYERWRKGYNWLMIGLMDGFKQLFAAQFKPMVALRNKGMQQVNQLTLVKNFCMKHAMGLAGDLPSLAKTF